MKCGLLTSGDNYCCIDIPTTIFVLSHTTRHGIQSAIQNNTPYVVFVAMFCVRITVLKEVVKEDMKSENQKLGKGKYLIFALKSKDL